MIGVLALLCTREDLTASRFFPLVPGDHWSYKDTGAPGTVFESVVKPEVNPPYDEADAALTERPQRFFPVEMSEDGHVSGVACYREHDNTVLQVGTGINRPCVPRPILVVSRKKFDWEYYGDNISDILTDAFHYSASCEWGGTADVLGKPHDTVVVTTMVTAGPPKIGVEVKQVARYAADVGLYDVTEDGHVGKNKVHHERTLVSFEPGGHS